MLPTDKHDLDSVSALRDAADSEVLKNTAELLQWLEDCNWPVFEGVTERLSSLGEELYGDISDLLRCDDTILKANIVGHLIPKFDIDAQLLYADLLKDMLVNPSSADFEEGLVDFIEMQLSNVAKNT